MQMSSSQRKPSVGWPGSITNTPPNQTSGSYQHTHVESKPKIEIYVDGNRCLIDGIWYKPGDAVVVLDAAIGKYNAKYMYLTNDEVNPVLPISFLHALACGPVAYSPFFYPQLT